MLLWLWPRKPVVYQSLEEKGDEKGDENTLSHAREPTPSHWVRDTFWALLACFFASTTVWLWWLLNYGHGNYKHGFDTELAAARSAVEMVEIPFTGELVVDENKTWTRIPGPKGPWYVGPPSDEIDKAWADLIAPINIDLEGSEAHGLTDTFAWPGTDKHFTGLTVHHSIHCLNMVRMAIYRDYYLFPEDQKHRRFTWIHLDHCIDFLRQTIQCQADLTPMKWHWSDAVHNPVLKAESAHTCRRWDRIQDWALQRVHILTEEENERMKGRSKPNRGSWSP